MFLAAAAGLHHEEGVERIAVARGVNFGVHHRETGALEVTANARKQIGLIFHVDHYLQALADGGVTRAHHRLPGINAIVQGARLPGDFLGVVAHEIGEVELVP